MDMITMNNIYVFDDGKKTSYKYEIIEDTNIYHFSINGSSDVIVDINKEGIKFNYYYSDINYDDNYFNLVVNNNCSNIISRVYNHGVNALSNKLKFRVDSFIPRNSYKVNTMQDTKIINMADGNSKVWPNLLIDNYDVVAEHAAYVGKFSDNDIFYLMSRGIGRKEAYKLLLKGFLIREKIDYDISKFEEEIDKL